MLWLPWESKDLACPQAQGASRCGERRLSLSRRFWRVDAVRPSLDPWKSATSLYWAPPSAPSKDRICPSPAVSNQSLCAAACSLEGFFGRRAAFTEYHFLFFPLGMQTWSQGQGSKTLVAKA